MHAYGLKSKLKKSLQNGYDKNKYDEQFANYKKEFNKDYINDDEPKRFENFQKNIKDIEIMQENALKANPDTDLVYGITSLSDLSDEEFFQTRLGFQPPESHAIDILEQTLIKNFDPTIGLTKQDDSNPLSANDAILGDIPIEYDGRNDGIVSAVKDQKSCASCYAFACVALVESMILKYKKKSFDLAEQEVISCDNFSSGCKGGSIEYCLNFVKNNGLTTEGSYPYTATTTSCNSKKITQPTLKIDSYEAIRFVSEDDILKAVNENGAVIVAMDASGLKNYKSGVIDKSSGCGSSLNHAVEIFGYGTMKNSSGKLVNFWHVKNSWGEKWGDKGFFKLIRGEGACGITNYLYTAKVSASN